MRNGYFQIVKAQGGFGLRLVPPEDGGEGIQLSELCAYLDEQKIYYETSILKRFVDVGKDNVLFLVRADCPVINETYKLTISDDYMSAVVRFYPPSEEGKRMSFDEFMTDLRYRNIVSGIQMQALQDHFQSDGIYCTDLVVAKGRPPKQGEDDKIEYYFNVDPNVKPAMREDGTVDYFQLNIINHCKKDEILAKVVDGVRGEAGINILGKHIPPRTEKRVVFKHGKNIEVCDEGKTLRSMVDGHVVLIDGTVFVSDVYEVENVDVSTGNIEYNGSVKINGNVASNFSVQAEGNVIINGVVEGAYIEAGGDIIIARGVNGMNKGMLKAGGNVVAKFIENATVEAEGYVNAGSILHSTVSAGTEIEVSGKRGFITGGHVQANRQISVKTLGAVMGAPTIVEVGADPKIKTEYVRLQKEVGELVKSIKAMQPILVNFAKKRSLGVSFTQDQIKYVREVAKSLESKKVELNKNNKKMLELQKVFDNRHQAKVIVRGEVYPGTTIVIGDISTVIQTNYMYCRFEAVEGEVRMLPM